MVGASKLSDRYILDERLAVGGMGAVWVATDERLGRRVAIKLLKEDLSEDPRFIERFRREARAAGALSHPSVARVFDYGEDAGRHYIVMELADGRDLARVLREGGALPPERAAHIGAQIADALSHAHAAGLVHRDVKPANVIVGDGDRVKVTDFGIARAAGDATLTATGSVLGTAHYISPEQASGTHVGPASDIYSFGIVLYEMLTGALPFTGDSALGVAMRHVNDEVPAPSALNPNIPPAFDRIVSTATQKDPHARFPDSASLAAVLRGTTMPATAERGDTETMPPEPWPFPAHPSRWDPARLGKIVLGIFVLLVLIAAALVAYRLASNAEQARERRERRAAAEETEESAGIVLANYVGVPYQEAEAELEEQGFVVQVSDSPSGTDLPDGVVWAQDPEAGDTAEEGETVTLFVSTGAPPSETTGDEGEGDDDDSGPGNSEDAPGKGKKDKEEKDD
ncbi:MAG: protein kinase domain-containing protein [Actinomycetota bacterium]